MEGNQMPVSRSLAFHQRTNQFYGVLMYATTFIVGYFIDHLILNNYANGWVFFIYVFIVLVPAGMLLAIGQYYAHQCLKLERMVFQTMSRAHIILLMIGGFLAVAFLVFMLYAVTYVMSQEPDKPTPFWVSYIGLMAFSFLVSQLYRRSKLAKVVA